MKALKLIKATRDYLDYLEEHILNVQKAWNEIQEKCADMSFFQCNKTRQQLALEINNHDVSKFSPEEFVQYRKHFFPISEYEKRTSNFNKAWEHHKKCNSHHWETWTYVQYGEPYEWKIDCVHMIIDWMAMGYKFNDTAQEYYEKNKDKINIPKYAEKFMYQIFERLY